MDKLASIVLYVSYKLLSLFDKLKMKEFLYYLNLIYKILSNITFARLLLNQIYDKIKYNIQIAVNNSNYLNFIINRSSNIKYKQKTKIFCYKKFNVLHLLFQNILAYTYNV